MCVYIYIYIYKLFKEVWDGWKKFLPILHHFTTYLYIYIYIIDVIGLARLDSPLLTR